MSTEISGLIMKIVGVSPVPIKRRILRYQLCSFGIDVTDRTLRKIYEHLPICSGPLGLFIPRSKEDVEEYEKYLDKKIPVWKVKEKINRIKVCHPDWYPFEENQELFK